LIDKTNWQQTNREHRYKRGHNGEDGRHLDGGETDQGVTL
jgi:hypothetical protein